MYRIKKKIWHIVFGIIALLAVGGVIQKPTEGDASLTKGIQRFMAWGKSNSPAQAIMAISNNSRQLSNRPKWS